jgi:hypothetical protein
LCLAFLLIGISFIPIDLIKFGIFVVDNKTSLVMVDKKVNDMIKQYNIRQCSIKTNDVIEKIYLTYEDHRNQYYCYWISMEADYSLPEGTYTNNINFGSVRIWDYLTHL